MRAALILIGLLLFTPSALAQTPPEALTHEERGSYVTIKVGIEMHSLEQAAQDTARATADLAGAVRTLAASPSLSEDQKAQLITVVGRVDTLSSRVTGAIDRLPDAVKEAREPLVAIAEDLAVQVRWTIIGVIALLLVVVLGALWGVYAFVLRPIRKLVLGVSGNFQGLVRSLERSTELAAEANAVQLELAKVLAALRADAGTSKAPAPPATDVEPSPT